jgi:uncharacterized protein YgiM (DUF1202 family)
MFGNLQQRLVHAAAPTPAEEAVILFGTTAVTTGAMIAAIVLATPQHALSSIATPLQWLGAGLLAAALGLLARRVQAHHDGRPRGRLVLTTATLAALLVGAGLASGIGAGAQETTFVSGDVLVTTDDLNLRDDASANAAVIETLPAGTAVTLTSDPIVGDDYTWYAVETDYGDGYVAGEYLADPATIPTGASVSINTDELNLRAAAGVDSEVLAVLDTGTEITVVSDPQVVDGITWYGVDTASGSGWVAGEFLALL